MYCGRAGVKDAGMNVEREGIEPGGCWKSLKQPRWYLNEFGIGLQFPPHLQ